MSNQIVIHANSSNTSLQSEQMSCSNLNTESFQVSTKHVCETIKSHTKVLFENVWAYFVWNVLFLSSSLNSCKNAHAKVIGDYFDSFTGKGTLGEFNDQNKLGVCFA